jgi:alpha-ketoglutarate-dependent taurine dioxygenase
METPMYTVDPMAPFGAVLSPSSPSASVRDLDIGKLINQLSDHKILVLRGFVPLNDEDYLAFCKSIGEPMMWEFGAILELRKEESPKNHIFSGGRVELHWDGAYTPQTPRVNVFQCIYSSTGGGGETLFSNTRGILADATPEQVAGWSDIRLRYSTAKKAHYGGTIDVPFIDDHPHWGGKVIRFIEPKNEDNMDVNPVTMEVSGLASAGYASDDAFVDDILGRLYDPRHLYAHAWQTGDFVLVDNNSVLHGRARVRDNVRRHLKRVHIL